MRIKKPSLAHKLQQELLPLTAIILVLGGVVAYGVAHRAATIAYDRALMDSALAIAAHVDVVDGQLHMELPKVAKEILLTDTYDQIFYEVVDANGKSVAGDNGLPRPDPLSETENPYFDGRYNGKPVRVAALDHEYHGIPFTVLSAETKVKRDRLVREILLAMLVPEVLLIAVAVFMIRRSVRHGLASIDPLREELVHRTHTDLAQLPLIGIPEEIYPIFAEVNELLARLSKSLDANRRFIADASHQLRTPIAALQAEAEMALRTTDPHESLKRIVTGTRRITHLAHQLLTLSRLEPQQTLSQRPVDLDQLTREAADRWMTQALAHNIDLGFELGPAKVLGDQLWLEELANNLIDNALLYTPLGGIVTVRCGTIDSGIFWEVEDSGPGIPPEEHERVFERFYRLDTAGIDGCGLGLAIAREIANNHNATISIEKGPTLGGARIRVSFPPL